MTNREFAVIDRYFKPLFAGDPRVLSGPGDDCAILDIPPGNELCVSTDTLLAGVHFPDDAPASVIANRTIGANLSDLAAMGATPHSFLLAITLPSIDESWLEEFSNTLASLIDRYSLPLAGGNLSAGELSLAMTVMGLVPAGEGVHRSGGNVGDDVYVTGTPGDAGKGLSLVLSGESRGYLARRYLEPEPRLAAGQALRGIASAMIDVSDGLLADARHIAEASSTGIEILAGSLPLSDELVKAAGAGKARHLALTAGDDYELCFTASPQQADAIQSLAGKLNLAMTRIGTLIQERTCRVVDESGDTMNFDSEGYGHF